MDPRLTLGTGLAVSWEYVDMGLTGKNSYLTGSAFCIFGKGGQSESVYTFHVIIILGTISWNHETRSLRMFISSHLSVALKNSFTKW